MDELKLKNREIKPAALYDKFKLVCIIGNSIGNAPAAKSVTKWPVERSNITLVRILLTVIDLSMLKILPPLDRINPKTIL